ncbi:MAG: hypothetical protein AB8G99_22150 [Planctomycetaceae bacterium]
MSRVFILTILVGGLPASGQLGGPIVGAADCPIEYLGAIGHMHQYRVRDCAVPNTVVFATSPKMVSCPVNCVGMTCPQSIYGTGSVNPDDGPAPEPKPITKLEGEVTPWQNWQQLYSDGMAAQKACSPSLSIAGIRRLVGTKLQPAKENQKQFAALVASVPKFLTDYVRLPTVERQKASVANFNRKLNGILLVSVNAHDTFRNPLRMVDLPTQTVLMERFEVRKPKQGDTTGRYLRNLSDVRSQDRGYVKVVDGNQTFYFQLMETSVGDSQNRFPVATLRTGVQVDGEGLTVSKMGTFKGMNFWTHRLVVDGKEFLVTTKDQRQASAK